MLLLRYASGRAAISAPRAQADSHDSVWKPLPTISSEPKFNVTRDVICRIQQYTLKEELMHAEHRIESSDYSAEGCH